MNITLPELNATKTNVQPDNKYLYKGKELQSDYDLFQLNYGARFMTRSSEGGTQMTHLPK